MTALEIYTDIFTKAFEISKNHVEDMEYKKVREWDSVGHMELISLLEETYGIVMEPEDIIGFTSYHKGKEILKNYGIHIGES